MKFYWIKTHWLIKKIFNNYVWDVSNDRKTVYLTFDDGPIPEVTTWVLNQLQEYKVKATFFCIGENINKHPAVFKKIIADGHAVGNHTFNHLNGWKTANDIYIKNIKKCEEVMYAKGNINLSSKIFRPPYGKITMRQTKLLKSQGYKIIMWDVLSADFDQKIDKEKCLNNVLSNIESGSIIVFHDSIKAFSNLEYALPQTLRYLKKNSFECALL